MKLSTIRKLLPENPNCPIVKNGKPLHKKLKNEGKPHIRLKRCKKGKISIEYCGGRPKSGWMGKVWDLTNKGMYIRGNGYGTALFIFPIPK